MTKKEILDTYLKEEFLKHGIDINHIPEEVFKYAHGESKESLAKKYEKQCNEYLDSIKDDKERKKVFEELVLLNKKL